MHKSILAITPFLTLGLMNAGEPRLAMQDDLWREFDSYRVRLIQLAKALPQEKYEWRPAPGVRSVSEVILHVALNNYMLLDMMGRAVPDDLYPGLPSVQPNRPRAIFQKNLEWEKLVREKEKVIQMVERAFNAAAEPLRDTSAAGLEKPALFFDRKTTIGGLQLRAVAHLHEHLGQLIAYARSVGVTPPWSQ